MVRMIHLGISTTKSAKSKSEKCLMKNLAIISICALAVAPIQGQTDCCNGSSPQKRIIRDVETHDSITAKTRGRLNPISELVSVDVPEEARASKAVKPVSLIARSEILNRGNVATLVPKRAVLHVPADLRGTLGLPDNPRLVSWPEFLAQNRAWIRTIEVSRAQAEGQSPLDESVVEMFKDCRQVVVATYQTGPISVLPFVDPEPAAETANVEEP